jgi:hypothetical protein
MTPTSMGTMETSRLNGFYNFRSEFVCISELKTPPFKNFADVWEMHLDTVFVLVSLEVHISEPPRGSKL